MRLVPKGSVEKLRGEQDWGKSSCGWQRRMGQTLRLLFLGWFSGSSACSLCLLPPASC